MERTSVEFKKDSLLKLRQATDAPITECLKVLREHNHDLEKAIDFLNKDKDVEVKRFAGVLGQYLEIDRQACGTVLIYVGTVDGSQHPMVSKLADQIAQHIAVKKPEYLDEHHIPIGIMKNLEKIYEDEAKISFDKMSEISQYVLEKFSEYYVEVCLYRQPFLFQPDLTVFEKMEQVSREIGETVIVKTFNYLEV